MKSLRLVVLLCSAVVAAIAQAPTIAAVVNSASYTLPGLPNAGIAQGSLFLVEGTNLGPANIIIASQFPLTVNIGGTSIQVTVSGTTVDAIMYYSQANQVAAILPSRTPTGAGTVKVTYNGQSATGPITVVTSNIGIFTVSSNGTGDAIAFVNSDNGLIKPNHAANPGDVIVLWGTGLGAVTSDETRPAVQSDLTNVPLQVFIGGKQANILFRGRNACCSSVDTVYVTVPPGVSGCAVSVNMLVGNLVSNAISIAVANSGRTCTPVSQNQMGGGTGTHTFGGIALERIVENVSAGGFTTNTKMDLIGGSFEKITYTNTTPQGSQIDVNSYGSCTVAVSQLNGRPVNPPSGSSVQFLDAGPSINLTAPFGNRTIPKTTPAAGLITYTSTLDQTATTFTAGQYTFTNGAGGPDIGPFTVTYTAPTPFVWTNQSSITTVNRANGVTINWTGGDPAGYVTISGSSTYYLSTTNSIGVAFTCTARDSDLTFTVPQVVLLSVPATGSIPGTTVLLPGTLTVTSTSIAQPISISNVEAAGVDSVFLFLSSVTYQ